MGFLRRTSRAPADHDDPEVDDAMWISGAEQRYKNSVARHYGSPDTISAGGDERLRADDPACALFFYQKAIDALHSIYVGGVGDPGGWSRRPSSDDAVIVDNYLQTLATVRTLQPNAPVGDSVVEVTHRMRTLSRNLQRHSFDATVYLSGLAHLKRIAPDIDVSGVSWS